MSEARQIQAARILLATDLSARCDRALDRAAQLAQEWQAELVALNVLDLAASPDQVLAWASGMSDEEALQIARQQLHRDLAGLNVLASIRTVRATDAGTAIRDVAASIQARLVVTGVARSETFGRFLLGSTVERLARMLPQPLLVVRDRARAPYRRIMVASDFSDPSRCALQTAAHFFPGQELILYHGYAMPLGGTLDEPSHARVSHDLEQGEYAAFVGASARPAATTVRPVIEQGALESTLTRYVREHAIELVVLGTHGRSGISSILLGSTAAKLLQWLPCDTLVVRDSRAAA
ncbi:MAG: universal stress protein [Burkholderiales bacterium]|nr:universal stress protein [Burkholderiales bacterium]